MPKSVFNGHGWFLNDDRASGGQKTEDDIIACGHCRKPMKKREWQKQGAWCVACVAPICIHCHKRVAVHGCEVHERQVERALGEAYRLEQNRKVMGL